MNWYLQRGKDSDVIISCKVMFSRNLRKHRFNTKNSVEIQEIENEVKSKLQGLGYNLKFIKIKDMDDLTKQYYIEEGLIDDTIAKNENTSILINDDENICIVLNSQDHIEIQVFNSGMELESTFNLAREIDNKFEEIFDIAKSKKYGYLTSSPLDVGTGLKAEVTIHLPGLTMTGNIRKIATAMNNLGVSFSSKYVSGMENIGDIYKIRNKQTLGISEDTIIKNIKAISEKIIEQERAARNILGKNQIELEDMVYRNLGTLVNARKLKWKEAVKLMSNVKMGVDMGVIKELSDDDIAKIYFYMESANLQKYFNQNLDGYDRDIKRGEMIRTIVKK